MTSVYFKKIHPDAMIPVRGTNSSAGFDLFASENVTIIAGMGFTRVPTGVAMQLASANTYGRIAMRSGLCYKQHLNVGAGVIDFDYSGEVGVMVECNKLGVMKRANFDSDMDGDTYYMEPGTHAYTIKKGERFAQLIIERVDMGAGVEVVEWPVPHGQHEGWGSTGSGV